MDSTRELRERFDRAGQGHVFAFHDELAEPRRRHLLRQLAEVDLDLVGELAALARRPAGSSRPSFEPPEVFPLARDAARGTEDREARERGVLELRSGRVGYLLVAGGQASRLGYDGPKGAYP